MSLRHILTVFIKIGFIAFGGPAAHAALMERELVVRRKWLTPQLFLDFLGVVNLIPGPNSTQLTMLTGYKLRGFWGMVAAGAGFFLPAVAITGLLAWMYVSMGQLPAIASLFFGIKPAVIAVIAMAILKLGKTAMKSLWLCVLGGATLVATLLGANEITTILGAGLLGTVAYFFFQRKGGEGERGREGELETFVGTALGLSTMMMGKFVGTIPPRPVFSLSPVVLIGMVTSELASYSILQLFWVFFKIGAVLFGSGYVLVTYMDGELVDKLGWLSRSQLLDAIAIGQFTPGPILSAATFAGYVIDGVPGAIVATLGIFLPSFVYILILYPIIPKLRRSNYASAFLDAVNIAAVAVMLSVSIVMAIQVLNIATDAALTGIFTEVDWRALLIMTLALYAVFRFKKLGSVWIILGGAVLGLIANL